MINITKEQIKELERLYQMNHKCKDSETKKLVKAIFITIDFINLETFSIDTGYFYREQWNPDTYRWTGPSYFKMGEARSFISLPILVILYIITKDDKYLKPSKYIKGFINHKNVKREYIKFSNTCYFVDKVYGIFNTEEVFKVN